MALRRKYGGKQVSWGNTYKAFSEALLDCGEQINERGKKWLVQAAEKWLHETDAEWPHATAIAKGTIVTNVFGGDRYHPWYYGQLHDSIAIRLSEGNRTIAVRYMPSSADPNQPQHTSRGDGAIYNNIIGAEWARKKAASAEHVFWAGSKALQAQLIVGVPYAEKVNQSVRHYHFLETLEGTFEDKMTNRLRTTLKYMMVKPKK